MSKIMIGSQIVLINFAILNTIYGPIRIVQIRCVSECSPNFKLDKSNLLLTFDVKFE
jgi:hypothetical protein